MSSQLKRGLIFLVVIIVIIVAVQWLPLDTYLSRDWIEGQMEAFGPWAPIAYGLLYFIAAMLLAPVSVLTVLAGTLFGKVLGTTVVVTAATIAAALAFLISRFFGTGLSEWLAKREKAGPLVGKVESLVEKHGFLAFFIIRSLMLHYMFVSYAAGLVRSARLWDFTLATFLTNCIFSFVFVYLGSSLTEGWTAMIIPIILVVLVSQVPRLMRRFTDDE
ncbi:MAG: VTT domain-containing protein [Acidobacteriota bacterium]